MNHALYRAFAVDDRRRDPVNRDVGRAVSWAKPIAVKVASTDTSGDLPACARPASRLGVVGPTQCTALRLLNTLELVLNLKADVMNGRFG